jgi:c(7)-type cytochrome triheme protein
VEWIKVHNLPDFVYFDHRAHVGVGVACQTCHGPVETMERVRQASTLSMGWCVNCHRTGAKVAASTDCATCHY